jgi:16S rRNA (guanine527-N7)-methyltransferase
VSVLTRARSLGFLGPGPVEPHVDRALDLAAAVPDPPGKALDLGSGAGVPGFPLALAWPASEWVLLDGSVKRCAFLESAASDLGLAERVQVVAMRAEDAARTDFRGGFDLVVARSFAAPAVTAECGSPFLKTGGHLVVAEPPGGAPDRWDPAGLARLGLEVRPDPGTAGAATSYQLLLQVSPCPERYPRRVGVPTKRPLF